MESEYKPNFNKAKELANLYLLSSTVVDTFPYSICALVKEKTEIKCRTYQQAQAIIQELKCEDLGSDDAMLVEYKRKRIILFNKEKYGQRVRFSIGHELGHHVMEHNLETSDKSILDVYEIEANFFSAQLLMPEEIINELIRRGKTISTDNIMRWFQVSRPAAKKRLDTFRRSDYIRRTQQDKDMYDQLLLKYKSFIDSIAPITYYEEDEEEIQNNRNSWYSDRRRYY